VREQEDIKTQQLTVTTSSLLTFQKESKEEVPRGFDEFTNSNDQQ
jgi:hypothetical protein